MSLQTKRTLFAAALAVPVVLAATVVANSARSTPAPNRDVALLRFHIDAGRDTAWRMVCRFPSYKVQGSLINTNIFAHKGPAADTIPDQSRCELRKLSGPGPVTLTVLKGGQRVAVVTQPGEVARLFLF